MYKVPRKLCAVSGNTAVFYRLFTLLVLWCVKERTLNYDCAFIF
jgi:hypothetical protein